MTERHGLRPSPQSLHINPGLITGGKERPMYFYDETGLRQSVAIMMIGLGEGLKAAVQQFLFNA